MLYRFFAKETFDSVDVVLTQVFEALELKFSDLKIKKQSATYSKPYQYIVEGALKGRHFILSLSSSALKEKAVKQQVELVWQCENPRWTIVDIYPKASSKEGQTMILDMELVSGLPLLTNHGLRIASNQQSFIEQAFDEDFCEELTQLARLNFTSLGIERKRLYYKGLDLPTDTAKGNALLKVIKIGMTLIEKIDH